ncbi:MAG TPA: hypothetical protein VFW33_23800 [Gemmataceae bacterium]|nr:hypothetical protein [Gemmataceae bacterium]
MPPQPIFSKWMLRPSDSSEVGTLGLLFRVGFVVWAVLVELAGWRRWRKRTAATTA